MTLQCCSDHAGYIRMGADMCKQRSLEIRLCQRFWHIAQHMARVQGEERQAKCMPQAAGDIGQEPRFPDEAGDDGTKRQLCRKTLGNPLRC